MDKRTENKLKNVYYSSRGYWKGEGAVTKLAEATKVPKKTARAWLSKQAMWQIYKAPPKIIPRPSSVNSFNAIPNDMHQADLLFLPHDKIGKKTYKYALTVVDVASRYKEAEALTDKTATQVASALERIYKRSPLTYPKTIKVDPGKEFMGGVNTLMGEKGVTIQRGEVGNHRAQGIVERFNRTLAERLFSQQYAREMNLEGKRHRAWVKKLPEVVSALNHEKTRLIALKPIDAIKKKSVKQNSATTISAKERKIHDGAKVRYLYAPGEAENDSRKRATDPIWSIKTYGIKYYTITSNQPILYYLDNGPTRSFVRAELQITPSNTELPPK